MFGLSTELILKGKVTLYGGQIDKPNIRIVCWLVTSRTPRDEPKNVSKGGYM